MNLEIIDKIYCMNLGYDFKQSKKRIRQSVYERWVFFKLAHEKTDLSLSKIGLYLNKDHATVIHALKGFDDIIIKHEPKLYEIYLKTKRDLLLENSNLVLEMLRNNALESIKLYKQFKKDNNGKHKETPTG